MTGIAAAHETSHVKETRMHDLDDHAQKLREIFQASVTAVPMADEAAANEALGAYPSLQHASDCLFDLLILLDNTDQTVGTVRALANHFFWLMYWMGRVCRSPTRSTTLPLACLELPNPMERRFPLDPLRQALPPFRKSLPS
jgi:hypothetical protein